jgi:stage II sporulation protein R
MRISKWVVLVLSLIMLFAFSGAPVRDPQPDRLLRLHVRANSDSEMDQALKIKVRDAVLGILDHHLSEAGDADAAEENIESAMAEVLLAAGATVAAAGFDYPVSATLGSVNFPTRLYGDQIYRAGTYRALQIYLGEGRGENWWCVLFPPLCFVEVAPDTAIPAATISEEAPRPKSRIVEWWQRLVKRGLPFSFNGKSI